MRRDDESGRWRSRAASGSGVAATRRRLLAGVGVTLTGAIAGCSMLATDESTDDPSLDRLARTAVYVDDAADLSVPDEVPTVSAPSNADLLVLPGDTDVGATQAVEWLTDDRVVALVGASAEGTWLEWVQTDVYVETFETRGYGDSEPDPDLLAAHAHGSDVTRYGRTWSDGPRERDLRRALDEIMVDVENRTTT